MRAIAGFALVLCSLIGVTATASPGDCDAFRCRYGDEPKGRPLLIAEPFHAFYEDAVIEPLRPYRELAASGAGNGREAKARPGVEHDRNDGATR